MKKYSARIAAENVVRLRVKHGTSRHALKKKMGEVVCSVLTEKAHVSAIRGFAEWLLETQCRHLKNASLVDADLYLHERSQKCAQRTVDLDRQALNQHLMKDQKLAYAKSKIPAREIDRALTHEQIMLLVKRASPRLALSIAMAYSGGLRAMELLTIAPLGVLKISTRKWHHLLYLGREHCSGFVVHGKGGLIREVKLEPDVAEFLENVKLTVPAEVDNRGADLKSYYKLVGGKQFTDQFSRLSKKVLGFTRGPHCLRHSFAQHRLLNLLTHGLTLNTAVDVLSQELGHFAQKNTFSYLKCFENKHTCLSH